MSCLPHQVIRDDIGGVRIIFRLHFGTLSCVVQYYDGFSQTLLDFLRHFHRDHIILLCQFGDSCLTFG